MAIEVKNLRIKVNINNQKSEASITSDDKNWTSGEITDAIQQIVRNQKER